ncbi:MAG: hypothetical protein WKG07_13800 [Hymenobacter sp.]
MTHCYRFCVALVALLAVAWGVGRPARAQQAPPTPEPPRACPYPPSRGHPAPGAAATCAWPWAATRRASRSATRSTIVPASVAAADGRPVAYDARTDRYQLVRPAPR